MQCDVDLANSFEDADNDRTVTIVVYACRVDELVPQTAKLDPKHRQDVLDGYIGRGLFKDAYRDLIKVRVIGMCVMEKEDVASEKYEVGKGQAVPVSEISSKAGSRLDTPNWPVARSNQFSSWFCTRAITTEAAHLA